MKARKEEKVGKDDYPSGLARRPTSRVLTGGAKMARVAADWLILFSTPFHVEPLPFEQYLITLPAENGGKLRTFLRGMTYAWYGSESVAAEVHSDDLNMAVDFDCAHFLATATAEELRRLAGCGFRGDYGADAVALFMASYMSTVNAALAYVEDTKEMGFEVSVDAEQAQSWLARFRPEVNFAAKLCPRCDKPLERWEHGWECLLPTCCYREFDRGYFEGVAKDEATS